MENPYSTPENITLILKYTHQDKPRLWISVILASLVLHASLWWIFSWLVIEKRHAQAISESQIPMEMITVVTEAKTSSQSPSPPASTKSSSPITTPEQAPKNQPKPITVKKATEVFPAPQIAQLPNMFTQQKPARKINQPLSPHRNSSVKRLSEVKPSPSQNQQSTVANNYSSATKTSLSPHRNSSIKRLSDVSPYPSPNQSPTVTNNYSSPKTNSLSPHRNSSVRRLSDVPQPPSINSSSTLARISPSLKTTPISPQNSSVARLSDLSGKSSRTIELSRGNHNRSNKSSEPKMGGLVATIIGNPQITNTKIDIPDQYARPKQTQKQLPSVGYLTTSQLNLNQKLRLKLIVLIDPTGKSELAPNPIEISGASVNPDIVRKLATEIINQWEFEPTYMEGHPVMQAYYLTLEISPF